MAKKNSYATALRAPIELAPVDDEGMVRAIVETPRGCRNKFAYGAKEGIFSLKKILPAGMVFPYDFGFLPSTLAPDGDPIDVLLLMDEPAFAGCVVQARLIGVIEGEQVEGKKKIRNDRLVAVAKMSHVYSKIHQLNDLPGKWIKELETFFVNYHNLEGKRYRLLGCKGPHAAMSLVKKARKAA